MLWMVLLRQRANVVLRPCRRTFSVPADTSSTDAIVAEAKSNTVVLVEAFFLAG